MPSSKTPPKKSPIQQPATHENCNRPAFKPSHNQNKAHRDCNNSTRGNKPNQAYHDCNNSMRSANLTATAKSIRPHRPF
ncbi:hypothetical protein Bpfe_024573 [Biomphalaria pfeifferi]|uniref:Uncharacterized protein n=1 Tax=Biomphalaria pfeifferi TaxID=112525 RepID=A0AAD8F0X3_BIOPF|nr:hypothetical protein Bpfe_024573 [Biomphalaria pfeifferi]